MSFINGKVKCEIKLTKMLGSGNINTIGYSLPVKHFWHIQATKDVTDGEYDITTDTKIRGKFNRWFDKVHRRDSTLLVDLKHKNEIVVGMKNQKEGEPWATVGEDSEDSYDDEESEDTENAEQTANLEEEKVP